MNTHYKITEILKTLTCKPGWGFYLDTSSPPNTELIIQVTEEDSRSFTAPRPATVKYITISHHFLVPNATYNDKTWRRWIFDCCRKVEDHELGEWFIHNGERPFAPLHGPGEDPYTVHEFRDAVDAHTNQRGDVEP